jgi:hypothetical protein
MTSLASVSRTITARIRCISSSVMRLGAIPGTRFYTAGQPAVCGSGDRVHRPSPTAVKNGSRCVERRSSRSPTVLSWSSCSEHFGVYDSASYAGSSGARGALGRPAVRGRDERAAAAAGRGTAVRGGRSVRPSPGNTPAGLRTTSASKRSSRRRSRELTSPDASVSASSP